MQVTFSLRSRLALTGMIRETVKGLPIDDWNRKMARAILLKIRVPDEELKRLVRPDGMIENDVLRGAKPHIVDLDPKEADDLLQRIKKGAYGAEDDDWFEPLLKQLEAGESVAKKAGK